MLKRNWSKRSIRNITLCRGYFHQLKLNQNNCMMMNILKPMGLDSRWGCWSYLQWYRYWGSIKVFRKSFISMSKIVLKDSFKVMFYPAILRKPRLIFIATNQPRINRKSMQTKYQTKYSILLNNLVPDPRCLNCEQQETKYLASFNNRSGYICDECYKAHTWARSDNRR